MEEEYEKLNLTSPSTLSPASYGFGVLLTLFMNVDRALNFVREYRQIPVLNSISSLVNATSEIAFRKNHLRQILSVLLSAYQVGWREENENEISLVLNFPSVENWYSSDSLVDRSIEGDSQANNEMFVTIWICP